MLSSVLALEQQSERTPLLRDPEAGSVSTEFNRFHTPVDSPCGKLYSSLINVQSFFSEIQHVYEKVTKMQQK